MSMSELERLYTPSQWSKRHHQPEQLLSQFLSFGKNVTDTLQKTMPCKLDVSYGSTERMKYDMYGTHLPNDAPILVFIHGGYYVEGDKNFTGFAVPSFVSNGIKVISIEYDLCPNVKIQDILSQIRNAVEHILKYARELGSKSVWVHGHSAGAHGAAGLLYDKKWLQSIKQKGYSPLLKGLILMSGIYDLSPLLKLPINDLLKISKEDEGDISFYKIDIEHADLIQDIKVIATIGEHDSPAFIEETRKYAQKLTTVMDNVEFLLVRGVDHFDIGEKLMDESFLLTKTIIRNISSI